MFRTMRKIALEEDDNMDNRNEPVVVAMSPPL